VDPKKLVGIEFDADEQCKAQYGPNATFCTINSAIEVSHNLYYHYIAILMLLLGNMLTIVVPAQRNILHNLKSSTC